MDNFEKLIIEKNEYSKQELVTLLKISNKETLSTLINLSNKIREKHSGNIVHLFNIFQISNFCSNNCLYCSMRKFNDKLSRFRLNINQIMEMAKDTEKEGFNSIILESGFDLEISTTEIIYIIKLIKEKTNLNITLCIGEKSEEEYIALKNAGADSYILKHKTSDPILYRQLHPDLKYSNRLKNLKNLKKFGFNVGSGIVVGLPGQTIESIANDILLFKELEIDTIQINPYIPQPNTPLSKKFEQAEGYFIPAVGYFDIEEMIYKIIATTRLVNKNATITIAQVASEQIDNYKIFKEVLKSGANSLHLTCPINLANKNSKAHLLNIKNIQNLIAGLCRIQG